MKSDDELNKTREDRDLSRVASSLVLFAITVNYPKNKVGAIVKMSNEDRELIKKLKSRHFMNALPTNYYGPTKL